jgi:hypothetical protein
MHAVELGGEVGRAFLLVIAGGPNSLTCYGMTGMSIFLYRVVGNRFALIHQGFGHLAVLPSEVNGVREIAIGGPGFTFPVLRWNGREFEPWRSISDTGFPASLN